MVKPPEAHAREICRDPIHDEHVFLLSIVTALGRGQLKRAN